MFEVMLIICALMRGRVVAVVETDRTGCEVSRYTITPHIFSRGALFVNFGSKCDITPKLHSFWNRLRNKQEAGIRFSAGIIQEQDEESFIYGQDVNMTLIDPPACIKAA